jgi:hypothetical protein
VFSGVSLEIGPKIFQQLKLIVDVSVLITVPITLKENKTKYQ